MNRVAFYKLVALVRPYLQKNVLKAIASSGSPITPLIKVAATVRFLAGGSYIDICGLFGLSMKNWYSKKYVLYETLEAFDRVLKLGMSFNADFLREREREFAHFSKNHLRGCVMAIDGWICQTRMPTVAEVGIDVKSYRNRKQMWGIVLSLELICGCQLTIQYSFYY